MIHRYSLNVSNIARHIPEVIMILDTKSMNGRMARKTKANIPPMPNKTDFYDLRRGVQRDRPVAAACPRQPIRVERSIA